MIVSGLGKHVLHDFLQGLAAEEVYLALLGKEADLTPEDRVFDGRGEVRATGYQSGGKKLSGFVCGLDNGIAWATWSNVEWLNASIKACGAVIYIKSRGNLILSVQDFGGEQTSSQGLFRVKTPPPGPDNALVWLA